MFDYEAIIFEITWGVADTLARDAKSPGRIFRNTRRRLRLRIRKCVAFKKLLKQALYADFRDFL
jgi:hypothetical protein